MNSDPLFLFDNTEKTILTLRKKKYARPEKQLDFPCFMRYVNSFGFDAPMIIVDDCTSTNGRNQFTGVGNYNLNQHISPEFIEIACFAKHYTESNQVKRTPQDYINELIIGILNPLIVSRMQ